MIRSAPIIMATIIAAQTPAAAASQPAATVVTDFLRAFAAKDLAGAEARLAPTVTMSVEIAPDGPVALKGRAAVAAYLRTVFDRYATIEITDVRTTPSADGQTVTVENRATYRLPDGQTHSVAYVWVVRVQRGQMAATRTYALPLPAAIPSS